MTCSDRLRSVAASSVLRGERFKRDQDVLDQLRQVDGGETQIRLIEPETNEPQALHVFLHLHRGVCDGVPRDPPALLVGRQFLSQDREVTPNRGDVVLQRVIGMAHGAEQGAWLLRGLRRLGDCTTTREPPPRQRANREDYDHQRRKEHDVHVDDR